MPASASSSPLISRPLQFRVMLLAPMLSPITAHTVVTTGSPAFRVVFVITVSPQAHATRVPPRTRLVTTVRRPTPGRRRPSSG